MTKTNNVNIELDIEDLLNLHERNDNKLEYDLNFIINNGMEEYIENNKK